MSKSERDVLAQCLRAIEQGQETPAECLVRYPEYRDELAPLLETASILRTAPEVAPRAAFRQTARRRLLDQLSTRRPVTFWDRIAAGWQPGPGSIWLRRSARVLVWIWVVSMVLFGGSRVVSASGGALPGDILYSVKVAVENVRLALAGDEAAFRLYLEFAEARVHEMEHLATAERFEDMPAAANRLERQLQGAADSAGEVDARDATRSGALAEELKLSVSSHRGRLEELLGVAPASARPVIERVLEAAVDDSEVEADDSPGVNPDLGDEADDGPDADAEPKDEIYDGRDSDADSEDETDDGRDSDADAEDETDDGPEEDIDSMDEAYDGPNGDSDSADEADDSPDANLDAEDETDDGVDGDVDSGDEADDSSAGSEDRPGNGSDDEPGSDSDIGEEPDDDSEKDSGADDDSSAADSSGSDNQPERRAKGDSDDDDEGD